MFVRLFLITSVLTAAAWAQTYRGNIAGSVKDGSGAALTECTVRLENPATGLSRETSTTGTGDFFFAELPLGFYTVTASHAGFETKKVEKIEVALTKTTDINIQLGIASQQAVIEVEASAVTLETSSSALSMAVTTSTVRDLPLNGRDFRQMMKLAPGVTPNGTSTAVNGSRVQSNNYTIDGADNNDAMQGAAAVNQSGVGGISGTLVPVDAIDQFSVQTNAATDVGRNSGSNMNIVIKSGSNGLHGSLYYFNRNEALAALSPLQAPGSRTQEIRNNQFGFSAGGPIIKNRTFFFAAGEVQLAVAALSLLDTSPSDAWVAQGQSVLSRYGLALNPVSQNLLAIWPAYSRTGAATANNYLANNLNTYNSYNGIIKIDHKLTAAHSLSARYLGGTGTQVADNGSHFKEFFEQAPEHVHNFSIVENWIVSPRLVNQVTLGVNWFLQTFNDYNTSVNPVALGLNTGVTQGNLSGSPTIKISGFDYVGANQPSGRIDTTGHITDNLYYSTGRHQLKFGGEFRRAVLDVGYFSNARGSFSFDGTRGPWASDSTVSTTLKALSDFLAGYPSNSNGATIVRGLPEPTYLLSSGDAWAHDTMQVTPALSLNFGVRYDYYGVLHDDKNILANFVPGEGFVTGPLYHKQTTNFAPRMGFSYAPKRASRFVLRGGYGLFYDVPPVAVFAYNTAANGAAAGIAFNPGGPSPVYSLSVKNVVLQSGAPIFGAATPTPPFGVFAVNRDYGIAYVQNFNLNVQAQLTRTTLLQTGYVGSLGRKLPVSLDINQAVNGVRPFAAAYPQLAAINQVNAAANSAYNSLQTSFRQQFWKGLAVNFNHTWSHVIDEESANYGTTTPTNSYNLRADRGAATFDIRQIATGFLSYEVPEWTRFAPRLTKGWQLNSLVTYASGLPFTILAGTNISGTGENRDRVDLVGNPFANVPVLANTRAVQYFNTAAFARPAAGTFGNLGRDALYGPGFGTADFSLFKRTSITERIATEFRVEVFNLFNRTNWANPNTTLTSASFGQLTQTKNGSAAPGLGFGEPRNVQLALKVVF